MDNGKQEHYQKLRKTYPKFTYSGYSIIASDKTFDVRYHFAIEDLAEFKPEWSITKPDIHHEVIDDGVLQKKRQKHQDALEYSVLSEALL